MNRTISWAILCIEQSDSNATLLIRQELLP